MKIRNKFFLLVVLLFVGLTVLRISSNVSRVKKRVRAKKIVNVIDKNFGPWISNTRKNVHKGINNQPQVYSFQLSNGLTVLVRSVHTVPKVSMQILYGIGSKHEKDGERGSAHLLEHMLFKGTHI